MCRLVSTMSPDAQTKHGAVIVDSKKRVVGTGYNGFIRGANDEEMPKTRPEKYPFIIHAEINAILNSNKPVEGCYLYVTGPCCNDCLKVIIQAGIVEIIEGDLVAVMCESEEYKRVRSVLLKNSEIRIRKPVLL